ncbi:tRNA 2-thiouridine(34) synthase MnmA [Caldisalinibacter kiritimatiensis]|uniref:tRNA-specific 2-thiouridylase MnmA n=1 Tax=Caldisalinibacter kiritimatiensis TaxID=1304284 RepID=R1CYC2_9FIRM|nr:tRNA 2-thiouridine(34) synthase MnmA [Caldisalinibacter kiritimatiensis]EOD01574.1 tRNA (5-methylaminomethyl-2-thiouridylate)-methyltransferase [Caldisalinibacter kiritimatiensis]
MKLDKNKVAVGLSGGVDSAVAAYLLKKKGYDVIGTTMILYDKFDKQGNRIDLDFVEDAKRIANKLDIPHYIIDLRDSFKNIVIKEFIDEYLRGRTPNPCVTCNRAIKYGKLIEAAHNLGAYYIATGHYARIYYDKKIKRYRIFRGVAERKDQAYMLYSLKQEQLKHILLPLGEYNSKKEIREIALSVVPNVADKPDSIGVCFAPNGDHKKYLASITPKAIKRGNFVDKEGNILGKHKGIVNYTIGQRRGLGINFNRPMFVVDINAEKNEVVLGNDEDTYSNGLIGTNANFTIFDQLKGELKVEAKVCQWGWFLPATVTSLGENKVKVMFEKKERAIAPGQSVVFYDKDEVIGGAIIDSVL